MVWMAVNRTEWRVMGGRQSSQGTSNGENTTASSESANVAVEENRMDRNSTGTSSSSRDSSNVDVSQAHSQRRGEASSHSVRVAGRSSRPSSSYAEGARSVRERVRILPTATMYSSSAPTTNQPLDIGLLLGFRDVSIASMRKLQV